MPSPLRTVHARLQQTIGTLPSIWVVGVCIALAILAAAVLDGGAAAVAEVVLGAVVVLYCLLRPADGLTVFGLAVFPSAVSGILGDGFDIPRWTVAVPLAALSLVFLAMQDRDDRRARSGAGAVGAAADEPAA